MSSEQQESDDSTEEQHPAERKGEWTVDVVESDTGSQRLAHGATSRVILMGLPMHSGWKAFEHLHLPHQTRVEKVKDWIEEHPNAREVAVVEIDRGIWHTVWKGTRHKPIAGNTLELATGDFVEFVHEKDWFHGDDDDHLLVSEDTDKPMYWATGTKTPPSPFQRHKAKEDEDVVVGEMSEDTKHGHLIALHDARE